MRRTIRKLKAEAKAKAEARTEAAKAKAEAVSPWALFRARRRRWARAAGRGAVREPRGCCRLGPSEARCAPLVRLLLLSDPGSWCSGTRKHLGHLPGLCSAHGGAAGHEQRGVDQHESLRGHLRAGAVVGQMRPLVRLLLLFDPDY